MTGPKAHDLCPNCFVEAPGDPCRHCGWRAGYATPAPYLPVGALFDGRYRTGRVLGHGGFGITYLGWDENLDLKLTIKEYLPRDLGVRAGPGNPGRVESRHPATVDSAYLLPPLSFGGASRAKS